MNAPRLRHAVVTAHAVVSGKGRLHLVIVPGEVALAASEGVVQLEWAPLTLCSYRPTANWHITSDVDSVPHCQICEQRFNRFARAFNRLVADRTTTDRKDRT